jgi:hypothetical protein
MVPKSEQQQLLLWEHCQNWPTSCTRSMCQATTTMIHTGRFTTICLGFGIYDPEPDVPKDKIQWRNVHSKL